MKDISGISNSAQVQKPQKAAHTGEVGSDLFKQSLAEAQAKKTAAPESAQTIGSLGEVTPTAYTRIQTDPPADVLQKTDNLLNLLDNYIRAMENPDKSMKDIEPLINTIKENAASLQEEADKALPGDENLRRIATDTAITANVEHFKFYRGDYI